MAKQTMNCSNVVYEERILNNAVVQIRVGEDNIIELPISEIEDLMNVFIDQGIGRELIKTVAQTIDIRRIKNEQLVYFINPDLVLPLVNVSLTMTDPETSIHFVQYRVVDARKHQGYFDLMRYSCKTLLKEGRIEPATVMKLVTQVVKYGD